MTGQTEDWLDDDGYPTDAALNRIAEWPHTDIPALLEFLCSIWWRPAFGWGPIEGDMLHLSTGGWSGNESLIKAMQANRLFWAVCWHQSTRGGHYVFNLSDAVRLKVESQAR
jgi:hypothetical protein